MGRTGHLFIPFSQETGRAVRKHLRWSRKETMEAYPRTEAYWWRGGSCLGSKQTRHCEWLSTTGGQQETQMIPKCLTGETQRCYYGTWRSTETRRTGGGCWLIKMWAVVLLLERSIAFPVQDPTAIPSSHNTDQGSAEGIRTTFAWVLERRQHGAKGPANPTGTCCEWGCKPGCVKLQRRWDHHLSLS